ncbi:MAG TPA: hypothetical protein PK280_07120 [Planctomycetota bacterium]|nr:hypothetical protein [Planctomycetota bacterium]
MDEAAAPIPAKPNHKLDRLAASAFLLVLLGCGFFLMNAGARHLEFYRMLNVDLPFFTRLTLLVSRVLGQYWYAVILVGLTLAVVPVLLLRRRRSWPLHAWCIGVVLLLTLLTYKGMTHECPGLRKFLNDAGVPADAYCGPDAAKLASSMAAALKSPDARHRGNAALFLMNLSWKLRQLKALPPEIEPALATTLKDDVLWVRINAAGAHWGITGKGESARPVLIEGLKSTDHQVLGEIARVIGSLGADGKEFLPQLRELAKSEDRIIAWQAKHAIERLANVR